MGKLRTFKCPHCLAPLSAERNEMDLACRFCGSRLHIENKRPPPRDVMARELAQAKATGAPANVYVATNPAPMVALGTVSALMIMAGVVAASIALRAPTSNTPSKSTTLVTSFPAECRLNGRMEIRDVKVELPGTAITATTNCKITVVNSTFKVGTFVRATGPNVEVSFENSRIESSQDSIVPGTNSKLRFTQGSTVSSRASVIAEAESTSSVSLYAENATLDAEQSIMVSGSSAQVEVLASKMTSRREGFRLRTNARIKLVGASLTSERTAIEADSHLRVSLDRSTIEAGEGGIDVRTIGEELRMLGGSRIASKRFGVRSGHSWNGIHLDQSSITSPGVAISGEHSVAVTLNEGALVRGDEVAIRGGSYELRLKMRSARVESARVAISGDRTFIDAISSNIKGATAYDLKRKPIQLALDGTKVEGRRMVAGRTEAAK